MWRREATRRRRHEEASHCARPVVSDSLSRSDKHEVARWQGNLLLLLLLQEESGRYLPGQSAVPERAEENGVPTGRRKHAKSSSQTKSGPPLTMEMILAWMPARESSWAFREQRCQGKGKIRRHRSLTACKPGTRTRTSGASELSNDDDLTLQGLARD